MENVSTKEKLSVISGSCLGFIGILIGTSLVVTFPTLIHEFNTRLAVVQWLASGYYLVATITMSTTAYLMKHFPLRRIFMLAALAFIPGCLISAFAQSIGMLLIGCMINAFATGIATPLMYQIVFHSIPQDQFGKYNGIVTMIKSFGPAFGPTYGGLLTYLISWRMIFIIVLPLLLAAFGMGMYSLKKEKVETASTSFDYLGLILFGATVITFSLVISNFGTQIHHSGSLIGLLIGSVVLLGAFIHENRHTKRKYLSFRIVKNKVVRFRLISFFSLQFMNLSLVFILPLYAEEVLHYNSLITGMLLLPGAVIGALLPPVSGKIYDKKGAFFTLMLSSGFLFAGVALYLMSFKFLTAFLIGLIYIVFRLGYTFGFGNIMSDAGKYVSAADHSLVSSIFNTFQQYSGTIGTSLMSSIITIFEGLGLSEASAILTGGRIGLTILVIIAIILIGITVYVRQLEK